MGSNKQSIKGNNNTQVAGDYIKTEKIVKKTEIIYDKNEYISDSQAKEIRDYVLDIAQRTKSYRKEYNALYDKFKITSYKLLPKDKFDEAIKFLKRRKAIYRPKLRKIDESKLRKEYYAGIYARAKQLNMNKEDILNFAITSLDIKTEITSLKQLSNTRLKKLHKKIFSRK